MTIAVDLGRKATKQTKAILYPIIFWYYCDLSISVGILEMPVVLEKGAKRERKSVQRLAFQSPSNEDKKAFTVEQGKGTPLGEIPYSRFNP